MSFELISVEEVTNNLDSKRIPLNASQRKEKESNPIYPYIGANNILGYIDEYIFDEKILCIAEDGGSWGRNEKCAFIVNEKCWVNNHAHVLTAKKNLHLEYLCYFLNYADLSLHITGATRGKLNKGTLNKIKIPLPDLPTQQRIAAILDDAQALKQKTKKLLQEYDALAQSIFLEMFGDPVVNPKAWEFNTVENVCIKILGGGTPRKSNEDYFTGNIPWVTPKDMKKMYINDSKIKITEKAVNESSAKLIPKNSILMVIRSGILKKKLPVAICTSEVTVNQDMKAYIVDEKIINPLYLLFFFFNSQNYLLGKVRAVTADNIEFSQIKKMKIPLPSLKLQNQFAEKIELIEQQKALAKQELQEAEDLFNCLLQKAFKGEL